MSKIKTHVTRLSLDLFPDHSAIAAQNASNRLGQAARPARRLRVRNCKVESKLPVRGERTKARKSRSESLTLDFLPYCRCVGSKKITNGKKRGQGNTKNGNKYLAWAYVEAANFAIRYSAQIKSFYQRKKSKTNGIVAIKAVARKLCRACYYIVNDQVAFDVTKAFA